MITAAPQVSIRDVLVKLLHENAEIDAAALYGSVARGDFESHSDIDVLLVVRNSRKKIVFDAVHALLAECFDNISIALYSQAELNYLHRMKSLFLLHLSRESEILFDRSGFLIGLLTSFSPKETYGTDFIESLNLLRPLRTSVEQSPNQLHRLAYLYSLFRVFGVYLLAEKGIYEFSKSRMVTSLVSEYPTLRNAVVTLSSLRVLNAKFFAGGVSFDRTTISQLTPTDKLLSIGISAISEMVGAPITMCDLPYNRAVAEFANAVDHCRVLNYRFRMWFLLLVYDGMNLYFVRNCMNPLQSLDQGRLSTLLDSAAPRPVITAANETLNYLRDYSLKYFLREESKINTARATRILAELAEEICR